MVDVEGGGETLEHQFSDYQKHLLQFYCGLSSPEYAGLLATQEESYATELLRWTPAPVHYPIIDSDGDYFGHKPQDERPLPDPQILRWTAVSTDTLWLHQSETKEVVIDWYYRQLLARAHVLPPTVFQHPTESQWVVYDGHHRLHALIRLMNDQQCHPLIVGKNQISVAITTEVISSKPIHPQNDQLGDERGL